MIRMDVQITVTPERIEQAADRAAFRNFGHAANRISKDAKSSIEKSDTPSSPGSPPHTRGQRGHNLKGAIRYASTKKDAVIGPIASWVGEAGEAHEFGKVFRGEIFDERPFMLPALEASLDRFHQDWHGSIY